ncbi:LOW QUALITY PROTEIN: hypothetical protein Cgig2_020010 [Carnegiea gigantea]|uniref:Uncharacterized protein n=1 Tax=Carnegiea gigantea TaxID=171969 RepID=A0A9Q1KBF4_9CARY|nr:LOW QUALITY PROTEIN: hypothetical protein Cgig2_020010 [Carnegiea gigantea]
MAAPVCLLAPVTDFFPVSYPSLSIQQKYNNNVMNFDRSSEPITENLGNNRKTFFIFIDNFPQDLRSINFKDLFSSFWRANVTVETNVHEALSDNSETIIQPLKNVQSRPIYVEEFNSQEPSCGSFVEEDEEIDNSFCPFDGPLVIDLQVHEKSRKRKNSNKDKKSSSEISKSNQDLPTPTESAK